MKLMRMSTRVGLARATIGKNRLKRGDRIRPELQKLVDTIKVSEDIYPVINDKKEEFVVHTQPPQEIEGGRR